MCTFRCIVGLGGSISSFLGLDASPLQLTTSTSQKLWVGCLWYHTYCQYCPLVQMSIPDMYSLRGVNRDMQIRRSVPFFLQIRQSANIFYQIRKVNVNATVTSYFAQIVKKVTCTPEFK